MNQTSLPLADAHSCVKFTPKQIANFWAKVRKTDSCWEWTAGTNGMGYGTIHVRPWMITAHRFSFILHFGEIPKDKPCVLHRCDNPKCVRPDHLFAGTRGDNNRDCVQKGRNATGDRNGSRLYPERRARGARHGMNTHPESRTIGERNGMVKLTAEIVLEIRAKRASGIRLIDLGKEYGLHFAYVSLLCTRKRWKHIP